MITTTRQTVSDFARATKNSSEKEKSILLGSALNEQAAGLRTARGQKVSLPLEPPSTFCPLAKMRGWEFTKLLKSDKVVYP